MRPLPLRAFSDSHPIMPHVRELLALEKRWGWGRGISRSLSMLDAYAVEDGALLPSDAAPWHAALTQQYGRLRVKVSDLRVDVTPQPLDVLLRAMVLPVDSFGEPLDGDEYEHDAAGADGAARRDEVLRQLLVALGPPVGALMRVRTTDGNNENTEHERVVFACERWALVANRLWMM
jgi:uncharacterized Ntn-hydrolase superfamily protein